MLALEQLLDVEAVGGVYQPLGAKDTRARGAVRDDADPGRTTVNGDRVGEPELAELLAAVRDAALRAVEELRAGRWSPGRRRAPTAGAARIRRSAGAGGMTVDAEIAPCSGRAAARSRPSRPWP